MRKQIAWIFIALIILASLQSAQAGPVSCAACLGASAAQVGAAAGCFALVFPPAIVTCLGGFGITGVGTILLCLPICISPIP